MLILVKQDENKADLGYSACLFFSVNPNSSEETTEDKTNYKKREKYSKKS